MNQQKIQLTQEGYESLKAELEKLKTVDRVKNLQDLKDARAQGDLSENAEYDEARDQQGKIEGRIKELEATLKNAVVISSSTTNLGKIISFEVIGINEPDLFGNCKFQLVSSVEAKPFDENMPKISNESLIGSALMQANIGDVVDIVNDQVNYQIKVLNIEDEGKRK